MARTLARVKKPVPYSETPVRTGEKWTDGKDVYQMVVTGTLTGYATTKEYANSFSVDTVISFENYVKDSSGSTVQSANCFMAGDSVSKIIITAVDKTQIVVSAPTGLWSGRKFHCIIKFTMA